LKSGALSYSPKNDFQKKQNVKNYVFPLLKCIHLGVGLLLIDPRGHDDVREKRFLHFLLQGH